MSRFRRGDIVFHEALGRGEVLAARTPDALIVLFDEGYRALVSRRALRLIARRLPTDSNGARDTNGGRSRAARDAKREVRWRVNFEDVGADDPRAGSVRPMHSVLVNAETGEDAAREVRHRVNRPIRVVSVVNTERSGPYGYGRDGRDTSRRRRRARSARRVG